MNNSRGRFAWKTDASTLYDERALQMIVEESRRYKVNRRIQMQPWREDTKMNSLRWHLLNEGNNCAFLRRNVSNVLIRWNKSIDLKFF